MDDVVGGDRIAEDCVMVALVFWGEIWRALLLDGWGFCEVGFCFPLVGFWEDSTIRTPDADQQH